MAMTQIIEGWFINVKPGCHDKNKEVLCRERQLLSTTVLVIMSENLSVSPVSWRLCLACWDMVLSGMITTKLGTSPQIISHVCFFSSRFGFSFPLSGLQYSKLTKSFDSEVKFLEFESWLQYVNSEIWGKLFTFFMDPSSNPFLPQCFFCHLSFINYYNCIVPVMK